jgi:hypothetical protein
MVATHAFWNHLPQAQNQRVLKIPGGKHEGVNLHPGTDNTDLSLQSKRNAIHRSR